MASAILADIKDVRHCQVLETSTYCYALVNAFSIVLYIDIYSASTA